MQQAKPLPTIVPAADITTVRPNGKAFAITCGLICGICIFALTWWIMAFHKATRLATLIGQFHRGYSISSPGSLIVLVWTSFDRLIGRQSSPAIQPGRE
jgi:hypothetical protein